MSISHTSKVNRNACFSTRYLASFVTLLLTVWMMASCHTVSAQQNTFMLRIAEIDIEPAYLEEYKAILKEESAASVRLEPGVIAILPMYQKENPTHISILEIYASKIAYEQHLTTPHFQQYKTTTLAMIKSLKLIEMEAIDAASMPLILKKMQENK